MLDLVAVLASLVCEVLIVLQRHSLLLRNGEQIPVEILILMRSWRFVRLINHGLFNKRAGIVSRIRDQKIEAQIFNGLMLDNLEKAREENQAYNFDVASRAPVCV